MDGLTLALKAGALLDERQAGNVVIKDVRGLSSVTDYYLVASGLSGPQLKAMADAVQVGLKQEGVHCHRRGGDVESGWMVLDYFDVVIHLFLQTTREYYALESLWEQSPSIERPPVPAHPHRTPEV